MSEANKDAVCGTCAKHKPISHKCRLEWRTTDKPKDPDMEACEDYEPRENK